MPPEGYSLRPTSGGRAAERLALHWEHEGNCAVRRGQWKLVKRWPGKWELCDMETGRRETRDVAEGDGGLVRELAGLWEEWAYRREVLPWEEANPGLRR
jgi:arylsulfatase